MVDSMDYFESVIFKWKNTIAVVMGFNQNTHIWNRPTYKEKWVIIFGHIHGQATKEDGLMTNKTTKDYFAFLLHLIFHDYNGLVYDYN